MKAIMESWANRRPSIRQIHQLLERARADLADTKDVLFELEFYLQPDGHGVFGYYMKHEKPDEVRDGILRRLNEKRLFREALDRIRADRKNTLQPPRGSPEPAPSE
jgi:hypothetical protein